MRFEPQAYDSRVQARKEEAELDAKLKIEAAAPDLLEACKYVVKYQREQDSGGGELFGLDFVTTCIAASAKATT